MKGLTKEYIFERKGASKKQLSKMTVTFEINEIEYI